RGTYWRAPCLLPASARARTIPTADARGSTRHRHGAAGTAPAAFRRSGCWRQSSCQPVCGARTLVIARSEATKQSIFLSRRDGLLRGACHRARIRATRWLAMTVLHMPDFLGNVIERRMPVDLGFRRLELHALLGRIGRGDRA